jgi:hypothetical protein
MSWPIRKGGIATQAIFVVAGRWRFPSALAKRRQAAQICDGPPKGRAAILATLGGVLCCRTCLPLERSRDAAEGALWAQEVARTTLALRPDNVLTEALNLGPAGRATWQAILELRAPRSPANLHFRDAVACSLSRAAAAGGRGAIRSELECHACSVAIEVAMVEVHGRVKIAFATAGITRHGGAAV